MFIKFILNKPYKHIIRGVIFMEFEKAKIMELKENKLVIIFLGNNL